MAYSYSGLKEFSTCQRKYYETRVLKKWPHRDTPQTLYGKEVHKALEDYVGSDIPLGPHERFKSVADAVKSISGTKYPEYEMALNQNLEPCAFDDENAFIRGIADIVIIDGANAVIFDYKLGKATYPDPEQLELMALMVFMHHPEVVKVKAALLFLVYDKSITKEYVRKDRKEKWVKWLKKVENIETAHEVAVWNENPSGLCKGYCPCEECPHWGELRKKF